MVRGRVEAEVGADVRTPERERARGPQQPLARPEHRLVGEVDDDLRVHVVEPGDERHAVLLAAAQLLGPAHEQRRDDLVRQLAQRVAHDRRVVLAVDER